MSSKKVTIGVVASLAAIFALEWFLGDWGSHFRIARDLAAAGVVPDLPPTPGRLLGWDLPRAFEAWDIVRKVVLATVATLLIGVLVYFTPDKWEGWVLYPLGIVSVAGAFIAGWWPLIVFMAVACFGHWYFEHGGAVLRRPTPALVRKVEETAILRDGSTPAKKKRDKEALRSGVLEVGSDPPSWALFILWVVGFLLF